MTYFLGVDIGGSKSHALIADEFGQVVGLYITTLFIVWQIITYISFKALPTIPIIIGGSLIIAGGLIITFWKK